MLVLKYSSGTRDPLPHSVHGCCEKVDRQGQLRPCTALEVPLSLFCREFYDICRFLVSFVSSVVFLANIARPLTLALLAEAVKPLTLFSQNVTRFLHTKVLFASHEDAHIFSGRMDLGYTLSRHCGYQAALRQGSNRSEASRQSTGGEVCTNTSGGEVEASHNWHGGDAGNEAGIFSFQHLLFASAFLCSSVLGFLDCRPSWPSKQTIEVLHHQECTGIAGSGQVHRACGTMWGAAGKLGVDCKFIHGMVTGEERAKRELNLKPLAGRREGSEKYGGVGVVELKDRVGLGAG